VGEAGSVADAERAIAAPPVGVTTTVITNGGAISGREGEAAQEARRRQAASGKWQMADGGWRRGSLMSRLPFARRLLEHLDLIAIHFRVL